ncbi:recombinase family protein [[Clostridium] scindens]|uniref:recombinase family protein n=2 Tax=Bacteria TaxID=2 RepID=UPI001D07E072|nr:recombinase family protein [[Clostridium] scindens]MCB6646823.1 recombinase family protein [[Clostridium] scindens]
MPKKMQVQQTGKWNKAAKAKKKREREKERIRSAFEDRRDVEFIPATIVSDSSDKPKMRVAAYCRVSTLEDAQAGSFELQIQHFQQMIAANDRWEDVGIYADEGKSGTNMKRRPQFQKMIQDCRDGKIDLILTKSVSRFARNTMDCLRVVRELKALNPPVGVYFEDVSLNTVEAKNEFTLGVMSLVAQGESEAKSAAITWSVIERFKNGIPIVSTTYLLGYDKDKFGKLVIVEEEAEVVRYIFNSFLEGQSVREIAESLTEAKIPTVKGKEIWSSGTVRNMLRNEKYCGDVLMQKTYTVDCFSHKSVRNRGQKPQYRLTNNHPAIVSREDWMQVQTLLQQPRRRSNAKQKPIEEKFRVTRIKNGRLKGYVVLDTRWRTSDVDKLFDWLAKNSRKGK